MTAARKPRSAVDRAKDKRRLRHVGPPPLERVRLIVGMMSRLEWETGKSGPKLAKALGVSQAVIERDAAEASRLIELIGAADAVRDYLLTACAQWIAESGKDRVAAARLAADMTGNLKARVEVNLGATPLPALFADALRVPGFIEWLVEQGWTPPKPALVAKDA